MREIAREMNCFLNDYDGHSRLLCVIQTFLSIHLSLTLRFLFCCLVSFLLSKKAQSVSYKHHTIYSLTHPNLILFISSVN